MEALAPLFLRAWTFLMALLPFKATQVLGNLIGRVVWLANTRAVKTTRTNLRHCFPEMGEFDREALAKLSLQHTGRLLTETGMTFRWSEQRLSNLVTELEGTQHIESALSAGRGVLVLVPHYGNWDLLALHVGHYAFTALYDPPNIATLDGMIRSARMRTGATLVPIDGRGLRRVYSLLKNGQSAGILPDQVPVRSAGVYAPFFGQPALTMTLVHRLVQSSRPLVLMGWSRRMPGGFKITFEPVDDAIYSDDVEVSTAAMNRAIELLVAEDPAQYQWEYKRFKKPPPGVEKIYRQ